jgi:hypothetical protein
MHKKPWPKILDHYNMHGIEVAMEAYEKLRMLPLPNYRAVENR